MCSCAGSSSVVGRRFVLCLLQDLLGGSYVRKELKFATGACTATISYLLIYLLHGNPSLYAESHHRSFWSHRMKEVWEGEQGNKGAGYAKLATGYAKLAPVSLKPPLRTCFPGPLA